MNARSGRETTPTNGHPLFTPWELEPPTSHASVLDHPLGGLSETLDQFRIWMEVTQHLSSDTFALTVKRRLRDQHSLPGWEWKEEHLWYCQDPYQVPVVSGEVWIGE